MKNPKHNRDKILIFNTRDEMTRIRLEQVCFFQSDGNYTKVYFINGVVISVHTSLVRLQELIAGVFASSRNAFVRIGKKYIVNSAYIFHINVLQQRLMLSDLRSNKVYSLSVGKEALRNLKSFYAPGAMEQTGTDNVSEDNDQSNE